MPMLRSRPEATSARPASTSSSTDQQRRRELVCRLLLQIYTRAERTRAVKAAEHASRRRRQTSGSDEAEHAALQTPLSLIELIQASYAVFERFGIRAPDDAVYHRHLLALAIDPEPDWRKKIRNFDVTRVQRLCRAGGQQQAPHPVSQVSGVAAPPSILMNSQRRRSSVAPNRSRRLSFASEPPTPVKTSLPATLASVASRQRDRFGDMLSLKSSPATESKAGRFTAATTPRKESSGRPASRAATSPVLALGVQGGILKQQVASIPSVVFSNAPSTIEGDEASPSTTKEAVGSESIDQFRLLATTFEQWRAMQAVKRLIKQQKDRDLAFQQQLTTPWGIRAVFHWIVLCLPERRDFLATESVQALPMSILRRVSVANMDVLMQSAGRVWLWEMKTLLASWRQNARNTKTFRVRVMIKQRAAVLELAFRCLQRWRFVTESRKCVTDRVRWISQRQSRTQLRGCLRHWRLLFQSRQQQKQATRLYSSRMARRRFDAWRRAIRKQRDVRLRYELVAKRRAVARWRRQRERAQASRALERLAAGQRKVRLLRESWGRLRAAVTRNQALKANLRTWNLVSSRRLQRKTIHLWQEQIRRHRDIRQREERFLQYRLRRRLRQNFVLWAGWTERRCALTAALTEATATRASKCVADAFENWQRHFMEASQVEDRLVTMVTRRRRQQIWIRWRKRVVTNAAARCLDSAYSSHLLTGFFTRWKRYVLEETERHCAVLGCQHRQERRRLARSWQKLAANSQFSRCKQREAERFRQQKLLDMKRDCVSRWKVLVEQRRSRQKREEQVRDLLRSRGLVQTAWALWRRVFWLRNMAVLAEKQLETYRKSHTLRVWKQLLVENKRRQDRAVQVVELLGCFHLHACFRQWKQLAVLKQRLLKQRDAVLHLSSRYILRARWYTWRLALETKRSQHTQLSLVVSKWHSRQLHGSFHTWKARWTLRKRHRVLLQSTLLASQERVIETSFQAWKRRWQVSKALELQLQVAIEKLLQSKVRRAVRRWDSRRVKSQERSLLMGKSLKLWRQTCIAMAFRCILMYTRWRKTRKRQNCHAGAYRCKRLMQHSFVAWQTWQQRGKQSKTKLETARRQLDRLKMARSLQRMRYNAQTKRRLKAVRVCAVAMSADRFKIEVFTRWTALVTQKRHKQNTLATQQLAMGRFRMRKGIQQWGAHIRVRKLLKSTLQSAVRASESSRLRQNFVLWKQFVARRVFTHALETKAAAFRYFCLLPLHFQAWTAFLATRKHKRELLQRARGLWSHQTESRAFMTWRQYTTASHQTKCAVGKWRNQATARSFAAWRRFEALQKRRRRVETRAQLFNARRTCQRALKHWRLTAKHGLLLRKCSQLWRQHTSRSVLDTWIHYVERIRSARRLVLKMRNQTLHRVFNAWKQRNHFETLQLRGIRERFALLRQTDTQASCWRRWRRYAHLHNLLRTKLEGQRSHNLRDILKRWQVLTATRLRATNCALQVTESVKLHLQRTCWRDWRARVKIVHCVEALRGQNLKNRVAGDLRQRLRRWQQFTTRSLTMKQFKHRQDLEKVRLVFMNGLIGYVLLRRKEKELTQRLGAMHDAYLREWLATKVQHRMEMIAACDEMRRTGSSKRLLSMAWHGWRAFHTRKQAQQAAVQQMRLQLSRVGSCQSFEQFVAILRRWKSLELTRSFETWRNMAIIRRQARLYAILAIDRWQKTQSSRHFRSWKFFYQHEKTQKRVQEMQMGCRLKRSWKTWRTFQQASLQKRARGSRAQEFHLQRVYQQTLLTWRAAAAWSRSHREQILELYHSSRLRVLSALLNEWREFTATRRTEHVQAAIAHVVYEEKLARRSFSEWKTNVSGLRYHRQQLQINTERLQVLQLCSSFRAWRAWSRQHKKLGEILRVLSGKCDVRTASQALTAWHLHAEKASALRHQAASFRRFQQLQKGVKALQSLVQTRRELLAIGDKCRLFKAAVTSNRVDGIFKRWRAFASLSRKTRVVTLQYLQNKLLPSVWAAWRTYVTRKTQRKDRVLTAALSWKNAFLRKAWNAIVLAHKRETERRQLMMQAVEHHQDFTLKKAVTRWLKASQENRHFAAVCGKLLARWRLQTGYRCFCAWHERTVQRKALRTSEAIVRSKGRESALLRVWFAWRKLVLVFRSGKRHLLQRYWSAWLALRANRRTLQGFQEQIQTQILRSTQRRSFESWKQFIATRKIERAMLLMSTTFAGTQLLGRMWTSWREHVTQTRAVKARIRGVLTHMQLHRQFQVFRALQAHNLLQKWKKHAGHRARTFRTQWLTTRSFSNWRTAVKTLGDRREKLTFYLNLLQHSLQNKSFGTWSSFVSQRKTLRLKMAQALAMRTQLCSRTVFQTWKAFAIKSQRNRKARGFLAAKTSAHAIKHWRQYVLLCKVQRMMGTSLTRQLEACFISWRKTVALTHQIRAFRAKSARRQWLEQVGRVFRSWQQRSSLHTCCRKLLASAALGNHLRFRFLLWQQFTVQRKRLAKMLLIVADPPQTLSADLPLSEGDNLATNEDGGDVSESVGMETGQTGLVGSEDRELVSIARALAQKARILQRFNVTWDLPQAWHRWRQIFHAQLFYRMRRMQFCFLSWQRFAHRRRRSRWIMIKLTRQREASSVQSLFRAWAQLVARVKQLQRDRLRERELWVIVTTEMARRERRQLKNHWHAWKFHVDEARHLQASLDAYYRARLVTKHWLVWRHDFHQFVIDSRRKIERVDRHMGSFRLHRALRKLREHQQRSKRARLVLEYFGNRQYDALLPLVLSKWRQWAQRQRELAAGFDAARGRKLLRHFLAWKAWKKTHRWQNMMLNSLQTRGAQLQRLDVWRRWRLFVGYRVSKDLALQKATIFHIRSRLKRRWLRYSQRASELRERTETACVQLRDWRVQRSVRRWRSYSHTRLLRRLYRRFALRKHMQLWQSAVKNALATRFDEFLLRSRAKKMLKAWQRMSAKHQYWRQLCASFMGKQEVQTTGRVFVQWQRLVSIQQGKRLATRHAERSTQRRALRHWGGVAWTCRQTREDKLETAARHDMFALQRQCLSQWRTSVKKQRERRFVLLSCVVKLESVASQRVLEVVYRAWKRVVQRERRCRVTLFKRECNAGKRALSQWLAWTQDQQQMKKKLESAAEYHTKRLTGAVLFYWQTYALAWQDAAKPHLTQRHELRQPLLVKAEAAMAECDEGDDGEDSETDVRRPLSPVMRRLREKKARRTKEGISTGSDCDLVANMADVVTFPEAVELTMDVKKRLLLLGKWKPPQKSLLPRT